MAVSTLFFASAGFDSARQFPPDGRLHGHGFVAGVRCALAPGEARFPGEETQVVRRALSSCTDGLDRRLLNEQVPQPSDENLALWLRERWPLQGVQQLSLRSTPRQGVDLDAQGHVHLWRRYGFQSAHRLPNVPPGHKCGRLHGHGFEALVQVRSSAGQPVTHELLDALWAPLHAELNYSCLNELPGLDNPTSEALSRWIWQRLQPALPGLTRVSVYETASCGASHDGQGFRIWKDFTLDSALQFKRAPAGSPLRRVHGCTYTLRLHLSAPLDEVMGWAVDFGDVKELFTPIFLALDHHPLHERADLADCDSATLAAWVLERARAQLPQADRVDLYETEGCGASVAQADDTALLPI
jgi:6-pyruvoyltetrahydropterin/6-carboxytetrahydropterin synthase